MSEKCIGFPCGKFILASGVTVGTLVFGCVMLATGGASAPLAPFYCSLITGATAFWAKPPSYSTETVPKKIEDNEKQKDEKTVLLSN